MENFTQLRVIMAREFLALNPKNVILGAIVQGIITEEYLPKLRRELDRIREDDVTKRNQLEKVIELWEASAKSSEWNNKAVYIIRNVARSFKVTDDEAEEAAQAVAVGIYDTDKKFYDLLYDHDPTHGPDGSKGLMGLWLRAINFRTRNHFRSLMQEKALVNKVNPVSDEEGNVRDPFDDVSGGQSEAEAFNDKRESDRIMREMRQFVLNSPKVKRSEEATAIFNVWIKALESAKHRSKVEGLESLAVVKFKRDVAPKVQKKYDIGYPQILQLYRKYILPAMADYLADQFDGSEAYFKKLLKAGERDMPSRIADEFYHRDMKAWIIGPTLKLQQVMRCYAEV